MSHTKGEWLLDIEVKPFAVYEDDAFGSSIFVAGEPIKGRSDEEIIANLRLGAAAPKMLEALESVLGWCGSVFPDHPDTLKVRAAIAAAKGEAA